jgi:DNA-binding MarR family transcriptional regulator
MEVLEAAAEPSADDYRRVAEFREAIRRFLRRSERIARDEGLTPSRYLLLLMIKGAADGSERSTVTELAERMQLTQSTITELVTRAEEAGLVRRRQSDADARVFWLELTVHGDERLRRVMVRNGPERRQLGELLQRAATVGLQAFG